MPLVVEEPDRAAFAAGVLDHRFCQAAEEPLDVRLAHQQIDRELHDFGLHRGEAVGAPPRVVFADERGAQHVGIG